MILLISLIELRIQECHIPGLSQRKLPFSKHKAGTEPDYKKRVKDNVPISRSCYKTNGYINVIKQIIYLCYKTDNIVMLQNIT